MGNAASNPRSTIPRTVPTSPAHQASPSTHKSLKTKKKSLELPDLASLAISPSSPRHPPPSAPIPIPISPRPNVHPRPQPILEDSQFNMTDLLVPPPSTHIPLYLTDRRSFARYSSTRSVSSARDSPVTQPQQDLPFVPEIVRSTIPLALHKATDSVADDDGKQQSRIEAVSVKIIWKGGGKSVVLIRSGDDDWKGRQPMDIESENNWVTWVNLFPGTHHIKFVVDDQVRLADDLPTAVDDEGSLANYVAVPYSPHSSPHSFTPPRPTPVRHNSFWSEGSSSGTNSDGKWTSELPPELIAAAREEEAYLASLSNSSTSQPAPNIPPAPILPRHLDKLILNSRVTVSSDREVQRERRRKTNRAKDKMTSLTPSGSGSGSSPNSTSSDVIIPVTTASGTDVTATAQHTHPHVTRSASIRLSPDTSGRVQLDTTRIADDASVLPVPSHVVLRHLSTSAIKNGVLAVADTVRYKQKFITAIYYKPT